MNDPPLTSRAQARIRFASYCTAAARGTFGPASYLGYCTLTDTLDVLGADLGDYDRAVLRQLGGLDPLTVAVLTSLFHRAAHDGYDPTRYVVRPAP